MKENNFEESYDLETLKMFEKSQEESYDLETLKMFEKSQEERKRRQEEMRKQEAYNRFEEEWDEKIALVQCGEVEVKTKQMSNEKKKELAKKLAVIVGTITAVGLATAVVIDILSHPENYFTTYENFEGSATFLEMIKRTPENISTIVDVLGNSNGGKIK